MYRQTTRSKIFLTAAVCLLTMAGSFPAMAAEINKVKIKLISEEFDETGKPEIDFVTDSEEYEVSGFEWKQEDIYEVELTAEEGMKFSILSEEDIRLSGMKARCSRAVRKDEKETLLLTIAAEGLRDRTGEISRVQFQDTMVTWDRAENADSYMVLLYKDSKRIGHSHKTRGNTYDFAPLMVERGIYHCKVYPLSVNDKRGIPTVSQWHSLDQERAEKNAQQYGRNRSGWELDEEGWRYWHKDGTFPQNNSLLLEEVWYHFDSKGYMVDE